MTKELYNKFISNFPNRAYLFNIIIFAVWFTIAFITGIHHEAWADEAQAWLIARDNSFYNLLFSDVLNYEGHPVLWYLIVRPFILLGLPYERIFIIPLLFNAIGIYLFIFKSKFPGYIKLVFPFSFYVFSMYPVIARSHSLIFPILAFIAVTYKNRLQKPFIYSIFLLLLANVSAHGFVIAGILFLSFCFDIYKNYTENKNINKKNILSLIIIFIGLILTIQSTLPMPADAVRMVRTHVPNNFILSLLEPLSAGYFTTIYIDIITYIKSALLILMYTLAFFIFCKTKQQKILFAALPLTLLLTMSIIYYMYWHSGYLILLFIFVLWILIEENYSILENNKLQKLFYIIFSSLLILQIFYGIKTVILDIKYPYCGSKNAAYFIIKNNLDRYQINGIGFKSMALQPYFKNNIYRTYKTSYWGWNQENYAILKANAKSGAPVIVIDYGALNNFPEEELKKIENEYNIYTFEGDMFIFGKSVEPNIIILCVRKDLN